ncbi:kinetochore-associated protein NSL1 homolog [Etheostoma spectabile]|uniref:kinetochore-associated protein NSL1 homolog n=1 Tax=Etheostoma spectabile TaxID=54343 RepID=UPI0013AF014E|nr:kinetochore-associated protein NSL1 homolog [Etheostoma spectabile]
MEPEKSESLPSDETNQEYRVQVTSKKQVIEQMNKYKDILKTALSGQTDVAEDTKRVLLQELLANFEAAVQDNVLVNGQPWDEAPDVEAEDEDLNLQNLLDDAIVETARRRRKYPKQILPHVVHSLKAERKVMELYEHAVKPQEVVKDPKQESIMNNLLTAAPGMVKQAIQVIKSNNKFGKKPKAPLKSSKRKEPNPMEFRKERAQSTPRGPPFPGKQQGQAPKSKILEKFAPPQGARPPKRNMGGAEPECPFPFSTKTTKW